MSRWRLAARLARREVRRHWVRSLLVVVIIALPVAAAQGAAMFHRSVDRPGGGSASSGPHVDSPETAGADSSTGFDPRLGRPPAIEGATRVETGFAVHDWTPAGDGGDGVGPDDLLEVHVVGFVPDASEVLLDEGRLPADRSEVVVSRDLAEEADLGVGDRLEVIASQVELEVVGTSQATASWAPTAWAGPVVADDDWVPDALARLRDSGSHLVTAEMFDLYWLPMGSGAPTAGALAPDETWTARELQAEQVVVGTAAGTIAVGFVATVCSAAFAIGARRQLRALGILASAGAAPIDLGRAVLLQGTTLGLAGGTVATALAYAGRAVVTCTVLDDTGWIVPRAPGLVLGVALLGVLAGTLASLVPALTASRIPTLSALAGRRPTRRRPLRTPYLGAALLLAGLGLLSWATTRDPDVGPTSRAAVAAVAVLATMAGGVALSPGVVATVARLCSRAPGTIRLSGRSLARDGMRSAAVVASAAVAVALPVVVLVWAGRDVARGPALSAEQQAQEARIARADDAVTEVDVGGEARDLDQALEEVRGVLGADAVVGRGVLVPTTVGRADGIAVDPDAIARLTGDDDIATALEAGAIVRLDRAPGEPPPPDGRVFPGSPGATTPQAAPVQDQDQEIRLVAADDVSDLVLVLLRGSEGGLVAVTAGADVQGWARIVRRGPLTADEERRLEALDRSRIDEPTRAVLTEGLASTGADAPHLSVSWEGRDDDGISVPGELLALVASMLVALAVIGVAMALAAADGRPDEQVIAAVGAPPAVVRRRRVLEATFTAAVAAVLGGGIGVVATLVAIHDPLAGGDGVGPALRLPIVDVLGVMLATVAVVGAATWLVLATGERIRGRRDLFLVDG